MNSRHHRVRRDALALLAGVLVAAVILGGLWWMNYGPPAMATPTSGGTLTVVRPNEPGTMNPLSARDTCSVFFMTRNFSSLFANDAAFGTVKDLVDTWQVSSNGLEWTTNLKQGVLWHDGTGLVADDVVYTYQQLLDPAQQSPRRVDLTFGGTPVQVTKLGPYAVKFTLPQPVPHFPARLTAPIVQQGTLPETPQPPGTGPFVFQSWVPGSHLTFAANADYFGGRPHLDVLNFLFVPDSALRATMLIEGTADAGWVDAPQYSLVTAASNLNVHTFDTYVNDVLGYNLADSVLGDLNVRRAIAHYIDRQALVNGPLCGVPSVARSHYSPLSEYYSAPTLQYEYSPGKAAALLEASGYTRTPEGWCDGSGQPLSLTIAVAREKDGRVASAEFIAQALQVEGIDAQVLPMSEATLFDQLKAGTFQAAVCGLMTTPNPDHSAFWASDAQPPAGLNVFRLADTAVDDLLTGGRDLCCVEELQPVYAQLQAELMDELPALPLYVHKSIFCVDTRVVTPGAPTAAGELVDVQGWYFN